MFQIHPPSYLTPLAPRNPNTCPYIISPSMPMSTAKQSITSKLPSRHAPPPAQPRRPSQNPLLNLAPATEAHQQRRREAYLGKVRQAREERKWEGRSEMILRAEFLERKKAWEEERKREAVEALPPAAEEEEEGGVGNDLEGEEVEMVDRILSQEEEEFEALVESMLDQRQENEYEMSNYGSDDDEEWDRLFREVGDTWEGSVAEKGEGGKLDKGGDGDGGMDMS